jgi:hypothetical protein
MRDVHGRRVDRSDELSALAGQVHAMERNAITRAARAHYAAVAAEYDFQAEHARSVEQNGHKDG